MSPTIALQSARSRRRRPLLACAVLFTGASLAGGAALVGSAGAQEAGGPAVLPAWCVPGSAALHVIRGQGATRDGLLCHDSATGNLWSASSLGTSFAAAPTIVSFCPSTEGVLTTYQREDEPSLIVCHRENDMLIRQDPAGELGTITYTITDPRCKPSTGARFRFGRLNGATLGALLLCHNGAPPGAVTFQLNCTSTSAPCTPNYVETGLDTGSPPDPHKTEIYLAQLDAQHGDDILFLDRLTKTITVRLSSTSAFTSYSSAAVWTHPSSAEPSEVYPCASSDDFGIADFTGDGKSDAWCRDRKTGDFWVGKVFFDSSRLNWQKWASRFCFGTSRVGTGQFNIDGPGTDGNTGRRADAYCHDPNTDKRIALSPLDHTQNQFQTVTTWSSGF